MDTLVVEGEVIGMKTLAWAFLAGVLILSPLFALYSDLTCATAFLLRTEWVMPHVGIASALVAERHWTWGVGLAVTMEAAGVIALYFALVADRGMPGK